MNFNRQITHKERELIAFSLDFKDEIGKSKNKDVC